MLTIAMAVISQKILSKVVLMKTILIQKNVDAEIRNKLYMKLSLFLIHFKDLRTVFAKHISCCEKKIQVKIHFVFTKDKSADKSQKSLINHFSSRVGATWSRWYFTYSTAKVKKPEFCGKLFIWL